MSNWSETYLQQECIPVGCVPSAAVAICWGVSARGVSAGGRSLPGGCLLGGVWPGVSGRHPPQTGVKTLPCCNYVADGNKQLLLHLFSQSFDELKSHLRWRSRNCSRRWSRPSSRSWHCSRCRLWTLRSCACQTRQWRVDHSQLVHSEKHKGKHMDSFRCMSSSFMVTGLRDFFWALHYKKAFANQTLT